MPISQRTIDSLAALMSPGSVAEVVAILEGTEEGGVTASSLTIEGGNASNTVVVENSSGSAVVTLVGTGASALAATNFSGIVTLNADASFGAAGVDLNVVTNLPAGTANAIADSAGDIIRFITTTGAQSVAFVQPALMTPASDTGSVAFRVGATTTEGWEVRVFEETLTDVTDASRENDLNIDIPSGAVILSVQANIEVTVVAGGTSAKIGIGTTADPDAYGLSADLLQNTKIDTIPDYAVLGGAEDISVNLCTAAGALGDTEASAGSVRVRIVYAALNSLDDA